MYKKYVEMYLNFNPNFDFYKNKKEEYVVTNSAQAQIDARLKKEVIIKGAKIRNIELRYLGINKENRTVVSYEFIKVK